MKLLNISSVYMSKYDDDNEFKGFNIYSNKFAIFIAKSEDEIEENIRNAYDKLFPKKAGVQVTHVAFATGEDNFLLIERPEPCNKCGSSRIRYEYENSESQNYYLCQKCGERSDEAPTDITGDDTIRIYRYLQEELVIVELYNQNMNPYPDNIMLVKYLIENTVD